jgi:hypothetical protein
MDLIGRRAQNVARALGMGAVATARVMQRGDALVVSAELLDTATGFQLWDAQYKCTVADIFATEEEIATEISRKLQLQLTPEKEHLLGKRYTENVEAYHLYLKGKFHWAKRTADGLRKGLQFFKEAIEIAVFDHVPEVTVATRVALLERAAAERVTLATSHCPFPGLGRIERSGAGWRWEPLKSDGRTTP